MLKKPVLIVFFSILVLTLIGCAVYFLAFKKEKPAPLAVPVMRMNLEKTVLASGTLNAFKTVEIGAQVNGELKKLHFSLGDEVKKGNLLAEIDPVLQENDLKEAEAEMENIKAQIRSTKAQLKNDRRTYERQKKLISQDAASQADLESAEAQLEAAEADLDALQAQLKKAFVAVDSAKANLDYTRISAPMDGMITEISAEEGQTLVSTQSVSTILTLADVDTITVKAEISEADVTKVKAGQEVYFTILGDPDKKYHATLRTIEPAPEEDSSSSSSDAVYYNGLFEVPNKNHLLRVGMTAEVTIILQKAEGVLVVPVAALINARDREAQVEVMEQGQRTLRKVRTGLTDKVHTQITEGLKDRDMVIVQNAEIDASQKQQMRNRPMGPPPGGGGPPR